MLLPSPQSSKISSGSKSQGPTQREELADLFFLYNSVFRNLRAFLMLSSTNVGKSYESQHIIRNHIDRYSMNVGNLVNFFLKVCEMAFIIII